MSDKKLNHKLKIKR